MLGNQSGLHSCSRLFMAAGQQSSLCVPQVWGKPDAWLLHRGVAPPVSWVLLKG